MTLTERIDADLLTAAKARDADTLGSLRLLKAAVKNEEIAKQKPLDDAGVQYVVARETKKLRDGLDAFEKGNREDLAAKARQEISLLEKYLPEQLDDASLSAIITLKISALGTVTEKDFGRVMAEVMKDAKGRAPGNKISELIKAALTGK